MSFEFDLSSLISIAAQFFNGLSPMIVVMGGLLIGVAFFTVVFGLVRRVTRLPWLD